MVTSGRSNYRIYTCQGRHFDERFAQIAFTLKTLIHHSPTLTHILKSPTTSNLPLQLAALRSGRPICMAIRSAYLAAGVGN